MITATDKTIPPIVGPGPATPAWYEARYTGIFASEAAKACGVSDHGQPLDIYLEKRRLVEPFEGNDYTDRGKRFEPFIAGEYAKRMGIELETGLPMWFHGEHRHIGATPDARRKDDPLHGVEFKACNFRRAAKLGEEHTDQIFEDWLLQTQQQMYVMGWHTCDVFVMVDLHTYRSFTVERNDALIGRMVEIETDLWGRIVRGDPPAPDFKHPLALDLVKQLYGGVEIGKEAVLPEELLADFERVVEVKAQIKELEKERDQKQARILFAMGDAEFATMPFGQGEIVRGVVKESLWTQADVDTARACIGQVKRKGYTTMRHRKGKK